ncbi:MULTISPECIES: hypothetical protein [unclassified Nonomuraea]|uniref:hypothetical protein n=1 Tax=unclassified Nonomuraea TaxID=2593643 RepID=UPI00340FE801
MPIYPDLSGLLGVLIEELLPERHDLWPGVSVVVDAFGPAVHGDLRAGLIGAGVEADPVVWVGCPVGERESGGVLLEGFDLSFRGFLVAHYPTLTPDVHDREGVGLRCRIVT